MCLLQRSILVLLLFFMFITNVFSEGDTIRRKLSDEESKELINLIFKQNDIKGNILRDAANNACKCIDSISVIDKSQKEIAGEVNKCIDNEVSTYQTSLLIFKNLSGENDKNIISLNTNKDSKEYTMYYREIEKRLMDSCKALKSVAAAENKESKYSSSDNPEALKQFGFGSKLSQKDMFEEAIPHYLKAVELDPLFVFAWDNLGYCYRNTDQLQKAINAYKKSLAINPYGEMPALNIAVAYEKNNETDKAIDAYKAYLVNYPEGVEGYFGLGRQFMFYKKDYEEALKNMCKAYNLYIKMNSPYRVDAEKMINTLYSMMKEKKKEKKFDEILKENKISINKN